MTEMNNTKGKSVFGAAVLGLVVGAVSMALAHKPTRRMFKDKLARALEEGDKAFDKAADKVSDIKSKTQKAAVRELKKTQEKLENNG